MQIKMNLINTIQIWRNEMCVFFTGTLPKIERERCEKQQLIISTCEAGSVCVHAHTCVCVCLCVCVHGGMCMCMNMCECACVYAYVCVRMCVCACVYV